MHHPKPRRQNDLLLKAIFEDYFADFLRFMYPDAETLFDFSREFVFMDKEMRQIIPAREFRKGNRIADLLVKVFLKNGSEKWLLIHSEIEGGNHPDFAFRLVQYHYRIFDRYRVPVETIVFFTGDHHQPRPAEFRYQGITTSIHFQYLSYHIYDHTEKELLEMDNPFALVVLACQKARGEGKVPDEELGRDRLTIAKALLKHQYSHDKILTFLGFLKNFLYIEHQEINRKFDFVLENLTGGKTTMGVIETIKLIEREAGRLEGRNENKRVIETIKLIEREAGRLEERNENKRVIETIKLIEREEGRKEQSLAIARELKKEGLSAEFIAKTTGLSPAVVAKL